MLRMEAESSGYKFLPRIIIDTQVAQIYDVHSAIFAKSLLLFNHPSFTLVYPEETTANKIWEGEEEELILVAWCSTNLVSANRGDEYIKEFFCKFNLKLKVFKEAMQGKEARFILLLDTDKDCKDFYSSLKKNLCPPELRQCLVAFHFDRNKFENSMDQIEQDAKNLFQSKKEIRKDGTRRNEVLF